MPGLLLGYTNVLAMICTQGGTGQMIKAPVTKCDMGTQTDTHLVESNIVQSYEWNEWELRRKAIKLVISMYVYICK